MYAKGKYNQDNQKGMEDSEIQEIKKEIAKLQQVEHTLTDMGESEESIANIKAKIKELKVQANGGVEQTRAQKAQSLLQAKNDKDKSKRWLRGHMMELSKQLADTNEKWKKKVEEIAGINQELAGLGWVQMDGDSDFEEEEE
eukprot:13144898-Heterocapsa_arctica.AAC.1